MGTVMGSVGWPIVGLFGGLILSIAIIWLWGWWKTNKIESSKPITKKEINSSEGLKVYSERSRKLDLEQYVRNLESAAKDIRSKAEMIVDGEDRNRWFSYEQDLRRRQLTVIQEIQDKEWQKVKHKPLTREEMREVERISLQEIRRLENL